MFSRNQAVIKLCHEIIFISVDFFFLWKKSFNFAEACFAATVILWPTHKQLSKWRKQNTSQTTPPCLHHVLWGVCVCALSCSVMSDSWDLLNCSPPGSSVHGIFSEKNTGADCHFLFQGISPVQGWNPHLSCLLPWQADASPPCHLRSLTFFGIPHCFLLSSRRETTAIGLSVTAIRNIFPFPPLDCHIAIPSCLVIMKSHLSQDLSNS